MGKTVKKRKDITKEYSSCKIIKQHTARSSRNLNKKHQHFLDETTYVKKSDSFKYSFPTTFIRGHNYFYQDNYLYNNNSEKWNKNDIDNSNYLLKKQQNIDDENFKKDIKKIFKQYERRGDNKNFKGHRIDKCYENELNKI
tara:strand:- start:434 stop:856 length:423 start_codon:yes stop_codon:yes gene_type:complete